MKSLIQLYQEHSGKVSDKWSLYLSTYDQLFSAYREKPVNLLEIGIQNGGSLEIWSKFFPAARNLVGCDINQNCLALQYNDSRISVIVADANSDAAEAEIVARASSFDLIIDDGSHTSSDIVKTFSRYFPRLQSGGLFVAEDLHCSYWHEFEGGLYYPHSSMAFFKRLADVVNHEHWGVAAHRTKVLEGFSSQFGVEFDEEILGQIYSVTFINSICIIAKREAVENRLGKRLIVGDNADVFPGLDEEDGKEIVALDQSDNKWSTLTEAPDELWAAQDEFGDYQELPALHQRQISAILEELQNSAAKSAELLDAVKIKTDELSNSLSSNSDKVLRAIEGIPPQCTILASRDIADSVHPGITASPPSSEQQASRIRELEEAVRALQSSTSWRITHPLRAVGHRGKSARSILSRSNAFLRREGIRSGASKVLNLWKREGIKGISQRLAPPQNFDLRNDYDKWVRQYDTLSPELREIIRQRIASMGEAPMISIVMPVYNPDPSFLRQAIDSVRGQLYQNWELCIADDASSDPIIRSVLNQYSDADPRIRVTFRESNGHISAASNTALEMAEGEWVALLDHDDCLPEHALFWVAQAILDNPTAKLIYSDEDKIDISGRRHAPYFKCDWNPFLFYSHNMICHLGVYEKTLLNRIGGFREGYEGAQDYDLALRCIEELPPSAIHHIPRVLYHWRVHPESTSAGGGAKPYAISAGLRALGDHLQRRNIKAKVEATGNGCHRVKYDMSTVTALVSLIIPTRNGLDLVRQCVESIIEKTAYPNYEIIIVDNGSDDPAALEYFSYLSEKDNVRVIRDDRPFNYSQLNNGAVELARGELIALVNNDIEVISPDWLTEMVSLAIQPEVGAVGARLLYPDDTLQHGGVVVGLGGVAGHSHKHFPPGEPGYCCRLQVVSGYSAVTAACLVIRKDIYLQVAGLNEQDLTVAFNDVDFCLRVREAGYLNVWTPYATLYHHESATRGHEDNPIKQARFAAEIDYMQRTWGEKLQYDPAYSPNLTFDYEDFSLAWPPRVQALKG